MKLRDYPGVINATTLAAEQLPTFPDDLARSDARQLGLATDNNAVIDSGASPPSTTGAPQNAPTLQPPAPQQAQPQLQPN